MAQSMTDGDMNSGLVAVFLENRPSLLRFLHARGAGDAAEDLLQDIWIKVSAGISGPVAEPIPYLYRIASNLVLDRNRAERRRQRRQRDWGRPDGGSPVISAPTCGERTVLAREELDLINARLLELGERTYRIFCRFRIDGSPQSDIAAEFGISLSAVEKHLQKAYRALLDLRRRLNAE